MTNENDKKLCEAFPRLYADRHQDMRRTCMCWGFECGDGWFDLIWQLSEKLEALIDDYCKRTQDHKNFPKASQVKEKFGTLRFYMTTSTDEMDRLIDQAESESAKTCENCGNKGKTRSYRGWWLTNCQKCYEEYKARFV